MLAIIWEAGLNLEEKRFHVALRVECDEDCKETLNIALKYFRVLDPKPIITWSDAWGCFVVATRVPKPIDEVKGFCDTLRGANVGSCKFITGGVDASDHEQLGE